MLYRAGAAALALLALGASDAAAVSQAGAIGLQFPVGARYNALGEAGTALATDASAQWWNAGSLAFLPENGSDRSLHFMYSPLATGLAEDVDISWFGYAQEVEGWGILGAHFTYLNQGEQTATDDAGNVLGVFDAYQFAIGGTYAVEIAPGVGLGVGMKYVRDELAPDEFTQDKASGSGASWGVDLGVNWRAVERVAVGFSLTNFGPDITFVDAEQSDPMPRTIRGGVAVDAWRDGLQRVTALVDGYTYAVEGDKTKVIGVGVEWAYLESLYLRAGYKNDSEGDIQDATFGFGFNLERWTGQKLSFDYASIPQATDLERVNRFSFDFSF